MHHRKLSFLVRSPCSLLCSLFWVCSPHVESLFVRFVRHRSCDSSKLAAVHMHQTLLMRYAWYPAISQPQIAALRRAMYRRYKLYEWEASVRIPLFRIGAHQHMRWTHQSSKSTEPRDSLGRVIQMSCIDAHSIMGASRVPTTSDNLWWEIASTRPEIDISSSPSLYRHMLH